MPGKHRVAHGRDMERYTCNRNATHRHNPLAGCARVNCTLTTEELRTPGALRSYSVLTERRPVTLRPTLSSGLPLTDVSA